MKKNKNASVILYVLILVSFALGLSYIVLSKIETTNKKINISKITNKEAEILSENANLNLKYDKKVNSDGNGFEDNYRCPEVSYNLSSICSHESCQPYLYGQENSVLSIKDFDGEIKPTCQFSINNIIIENGNFFMKFADETKFKNSSSEIFNKIFGTFNSGYNEEGDFVNQQLSEYSADISNAGTFSYDNGVFPNGGDGFDDDLNNDDYSISSTLDGYFDNDADARKNILGVVLEKNTNRVNLFVNTEESNQIINSNPKNIAPLQKLPELANATFKINFSKNLANAKLEIIKFPKSGTQFLNEISFSGEEIQIGNLDFVNNYYQIFLKTQNENDLADLTYKISETSGAYINPIKYDGNKIEILQNYVFNHSGVDIFKSAKFYLDK